MKILLALIASTAVAATTLLSGCATVKDLSRTGADELIAAPTIPSVHADFGGVGGFKCDSLPGGWQGITPSEVQLFERARYCALLADDSSLQPTASAGAGSVSNNGKSAPAAKYLARFVRQGIVLADAHCEVFLDAMEGKRMLTEFNLSTFNTLVGVATAAMSKLGNHPQSIFNLATGAAAANSFADNYKANFLLTGTMHQLRDTVKQYREELAKASALSSPATYDSFAEAQGDLREYASVCTHKGLVHLVNTKLAGSKFEASDVGKAAGLRLMARILADARNADPTITKQAFASGEFETLYEIAVLETGTRKALMTALLANNNKLLKEQLPSLAAVITALKLELDSLSVVADIVSAGRILDFPLGISEPQKITIATLVKAHGPIAPVAAAPAAAAAGAPAAALGTPAISAMPSVISQQLQKLRSASAISSDIRAVTK